ncbi:MAG: flavodoxin family protein, partial [Candidatus Omnitrophica bacterium]|nr:flavodoxin family protein [Candidatus Omnitrophota bacterium]
MKVIAINGSARKSGNTSLLIGKVFEELRAEGIECEEIQLAGRSVRGCTACRACYETKNGKCIIDDAVNECIQKMRQADGILLGSPVYVTDVSAEMKALIDRACLVSRANGNFLRRKAGAAVIAVRRGGALHAFDTINHFFTIAEMIVVGSDYWNFAMGRDVGDVLRDDEGVNTMKVLGQNMAWLLQKTVPHHSAPPSPRGGS